MSTSSRSKNAKNVSSKIDTGLKERRPISHRTSVPPSTKPNSSLRKTASTSFSTPTRPTLSKSVSSTTSSIKPITRKSVPISPKSRTSTDAKLKMQRVISTGSVGSIGSSTVIDSNDFDNDFEMEKNRRSVSFEGQNSVAISHTLPLLCGVCKQKVKGPVVCPNRHVFCDSCLQEWIKRRPQCPTCKVEISPSTPCLPLVGANMESDKEIDLISSEEMQERRERAVMRKTQLTMIMKDYEEEIATLQMSMLKLKEKCERNQTNEPTLTSLVSASLDSMTPSKRVSNTRASPYELLKLSQMEIAELQKTIDKLMDENTRVKLEMAAVIEEASQLKSLEDGALWTEPRSATSSPTMSRRSSVISKLSGGPAPAIKLKLALAENTRMKSHVADLERENETLTASLSRNEQYIEMLQRKIKHFESKMSEKKDDTFDQEESNRSLLSSKSFDEFKRGEVFT